MNTQTTDHDIVINVDTIDQLFRPPEVDPFSTNEIYVLGETALTRASRRFLGRSLRSRQDARLVIQIPAEQITPDLERKTAEAVRRYTAAKIEDNLLTLRLTRVRGFIGLLIVSVLSVGVVTLTTILLNSLLSNLGESAQGLLLSFVGIFVWVMLWDPLSKLLFEWVGPWLQNRMFHRLSTLPIIIRPRRDEPMDATATVQR